MSNPTSRSEHFLRLSRTTPHLSTLLLVKMVFSGPYVVDEFFCSLSHSLSYSMSLSRVISRSRCVNTISPAVRSTLTDILLGSSPELPRSRPSNVRTYHGQVLHLSPCEGRIAEPIYHALAQQRTRRDDLGERLEDKSEDQYQPPERHGNLSWKKTCNALSCAGTED